MKKLNIGLMLLIISIFSMSSYAEVIQGKITSLYPCVNDASTAFIIVSLDNGSAYRLAPTHLSNTYYASLRKTIFSTLLVSYERDYTVIFETGDVTKTKCGVSTLGDIQSIKLDKSLN